MVSKASDCCRSFPITIQWGIFICPIYDGKLRMICDSIPRRRRRGIFLSSIWRALAHFSELPLATYINLPHLITARQCRERASDASGESLSIVTWYQSSPRNFILSQVCPDDKILVRFPGIPHAVIYIDSCSWITFCKRDLSRNLDKLIESRRPMMVFSSITINFCPTINVKIVRV